MRSMLRNRGEKHRNAKPLKGFGSAGVVEIVVDHRGDTFRCVYTVRGLGLPTARLPEKIQKGT
jgi:phage-related protein